MIRRLKDLIPFGTKPAPESAKISGRRGARGKAGKIGENHKWLPVIDTDNCGGCGECARACEPQCLEMVWAFATLQEPDECTSCNECMEACIHDVIEMKWVEQKAKTSVGRWFEQDAIESDAGLSK